MAARSITEEIAVAASAEQMWKACFSDTKSSILPKACAGFIDAVEVDGDGGVGSITSMKLNPSLGENRVLKSRVVAFDAAARVFRAEVLEGGRLSAQLKTHTVEVKVDAAGDGGCVSKVKVDYERHDGGALAPEDEAKLAQGYVRLTQMVGAYIVAHPNEFA